MSLETTTEATTPRLSVWSLDGQDWVIASSMADAWEVFDGDPLDYPDVEWTELGDDARLTIKLEEEGYVTKTGREWAEEYGRAPLASTWW